MNKLALILGVAWIVFMTTLAFSNVGDMPTCDGKPYEMSLVFSIFSSVTFPFVLGLIAGRRDE